MTRYFQVLIEIGFDKSFVDVVFGRLDLCFRFLAWRVVLHIGIIRHQFAQWFDMSVMVWVNKHSDGVSGMMACCSIYDNSVRGCPIFASRPKLQQISNIHHNAALNWWSLGPLCPTIQCLNFQTTQRILRRYILHFRVLYFPAHLASLLTVQFAVPKITIYCFNDCKWTKLTDLYLSLGDFFLHPTGLFHKIS